MGMIMKLGVEKPVVIFSKSNCGMCHTIKTLIKNFGANPQVYELDEHPDGKDMEAELGKLGQNPSVPTVFIGKELVGGSDQVMSLNVKGELKPQLIQAKAIWV